MSNLHSPFDQFIIRPIIKLEAYGLNISFTNSSLFMLLAVFFILLFFYFAMRNPTLIPTKLQSCAEIIYEFTENTMIMNAGEESKKFFIPIFALFLFILACNLCGMLPYSFTVTSHIIVTFGLAIAVFISVTLIAILKHGKKFFSLFLPDGTPTWLAPIMIIVELFSYLSKPISLSVRLAANMIAGHVLIKVLAGFVVMLGIVLGFIPIPLIVVLVGFEIFVALLQAYIFTILTCVYLGNALHLH